MPKTINEHHLSKRFLFGFSVPMVKCVFHDQRVEVNSGGVLRHRIAVGNDEVVGELEALEDTVFATCVGNHVHLVGGDVVPGFVVVDG